MAERTVEFKFVANADLAGVEQFGKALGALEKKIKDVSDDALRKLGREVISSSEGMKKSTGNINAAASALNLLAQAATTGSKAYFELKNSAAALRSELNPGSISSFNNVLSEQKRRLTELNLTTKEGRAEYAQLSRSIFETDRQLKAITGGFRQVEQATRAASKATRDFNAAQLAINPITGLPNQRLTTPGEAAIRTRLAAQQAVLTATPALPAAGGSSFRGEIDSRGFGGGARARIRGAEIPSRILFDTSSRQDIRGGNAFAGPEFGVGYSQTYGAAPSSQLPPGYFDTRRRALGQESRAGLSSARTGNRFMAAGAISAGAFFGGPEGAAGGLIGAAIGGPAAALGGASIGAQVGIVRKQLGEFASLEAQLAKYNIALENVAGSQAEFARAQAAITSANERLNIPLLEGTQSFTQLAAAVVGAGGNINDAELAFNAVNSAIKATGGNSRDVEGALLAITQVFSKGKVSAEELRRQLGDRLPGAFNLFAASIGKTGPELDKALQDGTVGLNDLMTFLIELQRRYQGTAEEIAASSEDAGARLAVAWEQARLSIGEALQPIGAEFQEGLIAFLAENEEGIKQFAEAMAGATKATFDFVVAVGPTAIEVGKLVVAVNLTKAALALLTPAIAAGIASIKAAGGAAGLAAAGITKLKLATIALARAWAAPIVLTVGIIGVSKILGDIAKIKEARNELENLNKPSQSTDEFIRTNFRNSTVSADDRPRVISVMESLGDERAELERRVNDLRAQGDSRNQRLTSRNAARAQLATAERELQLVRERQAAVGRLLGTIGTGSGSATGLTDFPGPDSAAGSGSGADQASRDAERLAAEQRRLAEANAQLRRRLERQLFEYQLELDQKRYENLRRLSDLAQQNEINSLPAAQRRIAGLVAELRGAMLDVSDRRRSANLAVQDAQQRLQGAQQYESTVGAFTVPARAGGGATGGGLATFGRTGRMSLAAGYGMVDVRGGNRSSVVQDAADIVLANAARGVSTFVGGDMSGDVDVTRMAGARLLQALERGVDRHANRVARGTYAIDLIAPVGTPVGIPLSGVSNRGGATGVAGTTPRGNIALHLGAGSRSGGGPAGSPAVRAEIGNIRAEGGVEEAQNALRQAEELQKQVEQFAAAEISAYVDRFVIGTLQPIRDRTEAQRDELDVLKLRNRLLLEGADPAVIQLEEELLQLRKGQAAETTRLNAALKEAQDRLKEATDSGDASAIAKATAEVQGLEAAIEELPAAIDESAAATRNLFNESQRLEEPWERLQLAIVKVKKELKDLQDPVNQIKNLATGIGDAFGNSFGSAITGSSSVREALSNLFRDIGNLFADMVSRIIAKAIEAQILQGAQGSGGGLFGFIGSALFGGLGGSLSGGGASFGGGYFDPLTGLGAAGPNFGFAKGGGFAKNNIVPYATGGIVDSPTLFKFANGGTTRTGLMGEAGPEAILPLRRTASGDLGVIAAGGNRGGGIVNQVTVNVDAKGSSVSGDNNESRKLGAVISDAVRAELVKQQRPGGILGSNRTKSR
jgi:tape measure domain-containing protein